jgi:L-fuculose-phosphate aldolase
MMRGGGHADAVTQVAQRLAARGWVANHDGNVSVRQGAGRYLATPGATAKAQVSARDLVIVDDQGAKVGGQGKAFSEMGLHLTIYARRPDASAVVHAHPPAATALACAGSRLLETPFMAEAVVSLGPSIPTVPFALPGKDACAALAPFLAEHDAVLLAGHGVLAWGDDLEQAFLRLELVEHLARIALEAEKVGGVKPLPQNALPALLEARAKAGLGPAARGGKAMAPTVLAPGKPVVACAPSPDAKVAVIQPGSSKDLASIIREELTRALGEKR